MSKQFKILSFYAKSALSDFSFFDIGHSKAYFLDDSAGNDFVWNHILEQIDMAFQQKQSIALHLDSFLLASVPKKASEYFKTIKSHESLIFLATASKFSLLISPQFLKDELKESKKLIAERFGFEASIASLPLQMYSNDFTKEIIEAGLDKVVLPYSKWYFEKGLQDKKYVAAKNEKLQLIPFEVREGNSLFVLVDSAASSKINFPELIMLNQTDYFGTPLQKEYLNRLRKIFNHHQITMTNSKEIMKDFLSFLAPCHFESLSNSAIDPHTYFIKLMNMLTDFAYRLS